MSEPPVEDGMSQDTPTPAKAQRHALVKWSRFFRRLAWILLVVFLLLFAAYRKARELGLMEGYWEWPYVELLIGAIPVTALLVALMEYISPSRFGRIGCATLCLALFTYMFVPLLPAYRTVKPSSCQNNLSQMGVILKMFSHEHAGRFPDLSPVPGKLNILNKGKDYRLYHKYITNASPLICPCDVQKLAKARNYSKSGNNPAPQVAFDNSSYMYLGYAVSNDAEVQAFAEAYKERVATGLPFNEDLPVKPGSGHKGENKIHRLCQGVEKFFITDAANPNAEALAQSELPILIEEPGHHIPPGANVLYLDGHVVFIPYDGDWSMADKTTRKWPMTEETIGILQSLQALVKH